MTPAPVNRHIAAEWEKFERGVLTRHTSAGQRRETRRAFYAGAGMVIERILSLVGDDPDEAATAEELAIFSDIRLELDEYMGELLGGQS